MNRLSNEAEPCGATVYEFTVYQRQNSAPRFAVTQAANPTTSQQEVNPLLEAAEAIAVLCLAPQMVPHRQDEGSIHAIRCNLPRGHKGPHVWLNPRSR